MDLKYNNDFLPIVVPVEYNGVTKHSFTIIVYERDDVKSIGEVFLDENSSNYFSISQNENSFKIYNNGFGEELEGKEIDCTIGINYINYANENKVKNFNFALKITFLENKSLNIFKMDSYYRPFYFNAVLLLEPIIPIRIGIKEETVSNEYNETYTKQLLYYYEDRENKGIIDNQDSANKYNQNYCNFYFAIANGCTIRKNVKFSLSEEQETYTLGDASLNISQGINRTNIIFNGLWRSRNELEHFTDEALTEINVNKIETGILNENNKPIDGPKLNLCTYNNDYKNFITNENFYQEDKTYTFCYKFKSDGTVNPKDILKEIIVDTNNRQGISVNFNVKEGYPYGRENEADEIEEYYNGIKFYDYIGRIITVDDNGNIGFSLKIKAYGTSSSKCRYYYLRSQRDYDYAIGMGIKGVKEGDATKADETKYGVSTEEEYWKNKNSPLYWRGPLTPRHQAFLSDIDITDDLKNDGYEIANENENTYVIGICDIYTEGGKEFIDNEKSNNWSQVNKHTPRLSIVKVYIIKKKQ